MPYKHQLFLLHSLFESSNISRLPGDERKKQLEKLWAQLQELIKLTGKIAFDKQDPNDVLGVYINLSTFIVGAELNDVQVVQDWYARLMKGLSEAIKEPTERFSCNVCFTYITFFTLL